MYIVTLLFSAVAAALLIAPVAFHRFLFRIRLKDELVAVANALSVIGLGVLGHPWSARSCSRVTGSPGVWSAEYAQQGRVWYSWAPGSFFPFGCAVGPTGSQTASSTTPTGADRGQPLFRRQVSGVELRKRRRTFERVDVRRGRQLFVFVV